METIVQRDVRDLARIGALDALPRLLTLAPHGSCPRLSDCAELFGL
jgi:hypothetical protein